MPKSKRKVEKAIKNAIWYTFLLGGWVDEIIKIIEKIYRFLTTL